MNTLTPTDRIKLADIALRAAAAGARHAYDGLAPADRAALDSYTFLQLAHYRSAFARAEVAARLAANPALVPPAEVLARPLTPADVTAYPDFFITGPGRQFAQKTDCGHGYRLTDSCPCC